MSSDYIRILSIDPGLTISGWSILDYKKNTDTMHVVKTGLMTPNKIVSRVDMKDNVEKYGKRLMALLTLRELVSSIYETYLPDYVVVEGAFFHDKFPTAYAALLHWTTTVDLLIKDKYNKPVFKIPPKLAKHYISGAGDAKKITVQQAILDNPKIEFKSKQVLEDLIEHIADAIAIGWAFAHEYIPIFTT